MLLFAVWVGPRLFRYSLLRDKASRDTGPLSLKEVEERFDGNICRCTGYRPIMTAFHTFADEESADSHEVPQSPPSTHSHTHTHTLPAVERAP
jgi:xanthine dehydrogenase iron-sulfur cluster and FAD-binding subunit A